MIYTCSEYRLEMQLLALQRQLTNNQLSPDEKEKLTAQIRELERQMGMDESENLK